MLRSVAKLKGFTVTGIDGEVGAIEDVYFDDERWAIRYLIVDARARFDRPVLISPLAVSGADWTGEVFTVPHTHDQIRQSPDADLHRPVSRQYESLYYRHYRYPYYWGGAGIWGAPGFVGPYLASGPGAPADPTGLPEDPGAAELSPDESASHLHSSREVTGYHIEATDGAIGHIDDFLVSDRDWVIRYLHIDTSNWPGGKPVLLGVDWVREVSFADGKVYIDTTKETVKSSPEFDSDKLDREYETRLHRHYNRRGYWEGTS